MILSRHSVFVAARRNCEFGTNGKGTVVIALIVGVWATPAVSRAAEPSESTPTGATSPEGYVELSHQGLALYKARDFRRAAEKFIQAYALEPEPALLYNLARCYDALGDRDSAIEKYRAYIDAPGIDPLGRERAEKAIANLKRGKSPAGEPSGSTARAQPAQAAIQSMPEKGHPEGERKPEYPVMLGWIGTGLLASGALVTGLFALNAASELKTQRETYPGNADQIRSQAARTTTLGISADVLGLAAVACAGLSIYWTVASSSSGREMKAAVAPSGVRLTGSF